MPPRKPPPRTHAPEDEQKIQLFLERAASIVLECRVLDAHHWQRLSELAEELELSSQQLQETVEDLRQRGVIEKIDVRTPTPPPLPHPFRTAESAVASPPARNVDEQFALTAPPPLPVKASPDSKATPPRRSKSRQLFTERVHAILAEHRGLSTKARQLISATAQELGIPDRDVREVLQGETSAADEDDGDFGKRRWRTDEQPAPEASPTKQKPHETFREFVKQSLKKSSDKRIATELEESLVKHGNKVLRLSVVFARHLVLEVAHECGLTLASEERRPIADSPDPSPREKEFRQRAASILAEHRGINSKSRVLLTALGREHGLIDEQLDKAIASLQGQAKTCSESGLQEQRLAAFRSHLRVALAKLPRGILLPNTAELLVEQGQDRYGVESEQVTHAIQETVAELKLSIISKDEAVTHIKYLLDHMIGNGMRMRTKERNQVFAEGAQWGLTSSTVEKILSDRLRDTYQRRRSEQKLATMAIFGGATALTFIVGFLVWAALDGLPDRSRNTRPTPNPAVESVQVLKPPTDQDLGWWGQELARALILCGRQLPALASTLGEVGSGDAERRAAAYETLVGFTNRIEQAEHRRLCLQVLSKCYALDPNDDAVDRLAAALLSGVPSHSDPLVEDPAQCSNIFWRLRIGIAALVEARGDSSAERSPRAARLANLISQRIGDTFDETLPARALEQTLIGGMAERLLKLLIVSVETQPTVLPGLHAAIAQEATAYLDSALLDRLNAKFLVATLGQAAEQWTNYQSLIRQTILRGDRLVVATLVELFKDTENDSLRDFMEPVLRDRTGVRQAVPQLADAFLQQLGVRADATAAGRQRRLDELVEKTLDQLQEGKYEPEQLLRETTQLAWLATLAAAVSRGEAGAKQFQSVADRGPARLPESGRRVSAKPVYDRASKKRITRLLSMLNRDSDAESQARGRMSAIAELADQANRMELVERDASRLADYLLRKKSAQESQFLISEAKPLGQWKTLLLATAEKIRNSEQDPAQLKPLVEELVGSTVEWNTSSVPAVEVLQFVLLQRVLYLETSSDQAYREIFDRSRQELYQEYQTQMELLRVEPPQPGTEEAQRDELPSVLLEQLITHYATESGVQSGSRASRDPTHRLIAAKARARNDLHYTVLLERMWLHMLAEEIASHRPQVSDQVDSVLSNLAAKDRESKNLLGQLRNGQRAIVELWRIDSAMVRSL